MKQILLWAAARLKEPSTYAGVAGVVATMTFLPHAGADAAAVAPIGSAIAAVLAILLPEGRP